MPKLRTLLPALALAASLHAQLTPLQDPANLAGERVSPQDPADTLPLNHGAPALQQLLAKLRTRASLMLIVAHPDDEDGGLLTYESRGQGARVAMLTLTRGEGGQNLMSADFDDALGLIRTQELLAADRYFGVDQFFGTEVDFGFSKTKEETLAKWTHDRVLYDAVRAVRLYRPLVLASVFVGGPTDGHGQHQVAGEIAQEVFLAAADPKVFPEMIAQGLLPWAPLKVYARVPFSRVTPDGMYDYATGRTIPTRFHNYVTGVDTITVPSATVQIHEGDKPADPTLAAAMGGDTFVQFARKGLALQKTQIGNTTRLPPAGAFDAGYTLIASHLNCLSSSPPNSGCPILPALGKGGISSAKPATEQSLFDGIDTTLPGLANLAPDGPRTLRASLEKIDKSLAEAQRLFSPNHPEATAPSLTEAINNLDNLIHGFEQSSLPTTQNVSLLHELRIKRVQCNNALLASYKLNLSATISDPRTPLVNTQQSFSVDVSVDNPDHLDVKEPSSKLLLPVGTLSATVTTKVLAGTKTTRINTHISGQLPLTRPFFHRLSIEQPFYDVDDVNLRNAPTALPPFTVSSDVRINGALLHLSSIVEDAKSHEVAAVVPPLSVEFAHPVRIVSLTSTSFQTDVVVGNETGLPADATPAGQAKVNLHLLTPGSWQVTPLQQDIPVPLPKVVVGTRFKVEPKRLIAGASSELSVEATLFGKRYTEKYTKVGYTTLPGTPFYTPATYRATAVDLQTAPNLHIAYLPGTGDTVPDFLPNLGITPAILSLKDLTPATLNQYDAILIGVRAYAALPALAGPGSQPLLDYAKQGGVVIVQYNTARYGDAEAPFPISVPGDSAHNVVEEAQPVTLLHPDAPLIAWPNRITPADFDHWVAERGHGFAATWSPSYTPMLETHDVGQDPQQGGLLLARTGKGAYIYCALALYRQLPEGVPGAYRLLANLLSYAKNPAMR